MEQPVLVVMAAGMGSRYGGLKQVDPVGPNDQTLMDYSLYDAYRAGFRRVAFVISSAMEETFVPLMRKRLEARFEVLFAVQQLEDIPPGYAVPADRVKPWGTGHAVRACRGCFHAPFAAVNADDYYGISAFEMIYRFLCGVREESGHYAMVGYELSNTLSKQGHVARGICKKDEKNRLVGIRERTHVVWSSDGPLYTEDGQLYHRLPEDAIASMNLWGFSAEFMQALDERFTCFLDRVLADNPTRGEFYLPEVVGRMIEEKKALVDVLPCDERWFGVTYRQDRPTVEAAIREMTDRNVYPQRLW